jgi:hypothetical protein
VIFRLSGPQCEHPKDSLVKKKSFAGFGEIVVCRLCHQIVRGRKTSLVTETK